VSASGDNTVKLWNAGSGTLLQTFQVGAVVQTLSFSEDGTSLLIERRSLPILLSLSGVTAISSPLLPPSIFVEDQWVSRCTERILGFLLSIGHIVLLFIRVLLLSGIRLEEL
jgi:WD40 repeat protein